MKRKVKKMADGGYGRFTEDSPKSVEDMKEGIAAGAPAEDDSDTYAPKTRTFSKTEPEKKKAKEPKASQDDAFPKKDRSSADTNNASSSYAPPQTKKSEGTSEKKYGIGPYGAFGGVERFFEKNFKTPAQRRYEEKAPKKMASGGKVSSASSRADGIAQRGKTRGKMC